MIVMPMPVAAAIVFTPPEDRTFRYKTVQTRDDGAVRRTFTVERRITFRRDSAGLVADVLTVGTSQDSGGELAARFAAGAGSLTGRTLHLHLDPQGQIVAIDDEAAVWDALTAGIAAMAKGNHAAPSSIAANPAAALRAMPPDRRRGVIGSILSPIISCIDAGALPASRPVRIASGALPGRALALDGIETITRQPDGTIRFVTQASGGDEGGRVTIDRDRVVDPATGLVASERETIRTTIGDRVATTSSTSTLEPMVF